MQCPSCQFDNPAGMRFCGKCATPLDAGPAEGERRQLTVMFCDISGSTSLSTELDPEDLRDVLRDYQDTCARVVQEFEGHVAQYLGDGLLVYFGYPVAREDAAPRAVHAALEILRRVAHLGESLQRESGIELATHIGIHTGLVVTGEMGRGEARELHAAVGETPNVAARVTDAAAPGTAVVSAASALLVRHAFELEPLGSTVLRGLAEPVDLFRVVRALEHPRSPHLAPLIGREREAECLTECWDRVRSGIGQVVLVEGEAGIGKSRLVEHVADLTDGGPDPPLRWQCFGSHYHRHSAFHPLIDAILRACGIEREQPAEERLERLERSLRGVAADETPALIASLLSIPLPERLALPQRTPAEQKRRTQEALLDVIRGASERRPVQLIVEDLHWVDPSTLEFLDRLVHSCGSQRVMALFTFRPQFEPPWTPRSGVTHLVLDGLDTGQVGELLEAVAGGKRLPPEVVQLVVDKADGVPLFVEEVGRSVLESGLLEEHDGTYRLPRPIHELSIPATVADSLIERLDRLASAKPVAQLASVLGRSFSLALIQAVSPLEPVELSRELGRLVDSGILHRRDEPEDPGFEFKHALLRDAAYESLLRRSRQRAHRRSAEVLTEHFPWTLSSQPELIAHHYTEAGQVEAAVPLWLAAGRLAAQRSASAEALDLLQRGLDLVPRLRAGKERAETELALCVARFGPLIAVKGYTSGEMEGTVSRALQLCGEIGQTPMLFPVLYGRWAFLYAAGRAQEGYEKAKEFLSLAEAQDSTPLRVVGHRLVCHSSSTVGRFHEGREHIRRLLELYDLERDRPLALLYGTDPRITTLGIAAVVEWALGRLDTALAAAHRGLEESRSHPHLNTRGYALIWCGVLPQLLCRDGPGAERGAQEAIEFARDRELPLWVAWGTAFLGCARVQQGHHAEGIDALHRGLDGLAAQHFGLLRSATLTWLAEAYGAAGKPEQGLEHAAEALRLLEIGGDRFFEAESHRVRGVLLHQAGADVDEARASLLRAREVARSQRALTLELRAAVQLARLDRESGRGEQGQALLEPLTGAFREGLERPDLRDAREELSRLSAP